MFAILFVAASLGLSNFAAAIGIGISGVDARTRTEVVVVFGLFEVTMPIAGLLLGHRLAHTLGNSSRWLGGGLLIATGLYALVTSLHTEHDDIGTSANIARPRLVLTALALSIDNLAVGFALGAYHVSIVLAAVIIGVVSVTLSLIGLELGARLGTRTRDRAEILGGLVLIAVGIVVAAGVL